MKEIDETILNIAQELCNKHDWICRDPGEKCREKAPTNVRQMKREFAKVCRKHIKKLLAAHEW